MAVLILLYAFPFSPRQTIHHRTSCTKCDRFTRILPTE